MACAKPASLHYVAHSMARKSYLGRRFRCAFKGCFHTFKGQCSMSMHSKVFKCIQGSTNASKGHLCASKGKLTLIHVGSLARFFSMAPVPESASKAVKLWMQSLEAGYETQQMNRVDRIAHKATGQNHVQLLQPTWAKKFLDTRVSDDKRVHRLASCCFSIR